MNKLKLIKTIVFILTFLLVFGSLAFLGSLFKKVNSSPILIKEEISLNEPDGSTIQKIHFQNKILYITVKDGGLPDRIIMFDPLQGQKLSTISIN